MIMGVVPGLVVVGTDDAELQPQASAGLAENGRNNINPASNEPTNNHFRKALNDLVLMYPDPPTENIRSDHS